MKVNFTPFETAARSEVEEFFFVRLDCHRPKILCAKRFFCDRIIDTVTFRGSQMVLQHLPSEHIEPQTPIVILEYTPALIRI